LGRRYALEVDAASATVMVGSEDDLLTDHVELTGRTWVGGPLPVGAVVLAQAKHTGAETVRLHRHRRAVPGGPRPSRRAGQTVALYKGDEVVGSGIAA